MNDTPRPPTPPHEASANARAREIFELWSAYPGDQMKIRALRTFGIYYAADLSWALKHALDHLDAQEHIIEHCCQVDQPGIVYPPGVTRSLRRSPQVAPRPSPKLSQKRYRSKHKSSAKLAVVEGSG